MMDIQKERKAFNKEFGADDSDSKLPFGDGIESSAALKCNWLGWKKRAELEYRNNPETIEISGLETISKLCKFADKYDMAGCTFTEIVERIFEDLNQTQVPEGFVLVPKSEIGHYYYDESEGMYIDEPDHFLTDLDIGEAQEVKCRDYFDLPSKYAAKVWDEDNQDVGTWELFDTEAEANNVAEHCKAMIEAQDQSNDPI